MALVIIIIILIIRSVPLITQILSRIKGLGDGTVEKK